MPSTQGCEHACVQATGTSGLPEDIIPGKLVDNTECKAGKAETTRHGPKLNRYSGISFEPLGAGFGAKNHDVTFGPELSFGVEIGKRFEDAMLLKVAMGGSSLGDHWRVDGPLYAQLVKETKDALEQHQADLAGFVWFQGFNDQFRDVWCNELSSAYESRLKAFLVKLRADVKVDVPVVIVKARSSFKLPEIQQAQDAVAAALPKVYVVPSADLSECFHYDSGSQVVIGERAATAMLAMLSNGTLQEAPQVTSTIAAESSTTTATARNSGAQGPIGEGGTTTPPSLNGATTTTPLLNKGSTPEAPQVTPTITTTSAMNSGTQGSIGERGATTTSPSLTNGSPPEALQITSTVTSTMTNEYPTTTAKARAYGPQVMIGGRAATATLQMLSNGTSSGPPPVTSIAETHEAFAASATARDCLHKYCVLACLLPAFLP